jgi:hypothetical protein
VTGDTLAWPALLALGLGHGVNPAMGWLFAAASGMQEKSARAVWRALIPLAAGHGAAIALVVILAQAAGVVVPPVVLRWTVAGLLLALGVYRLVRSRHPALAGMRVSSRQVASWSALMATAHGAGLMVIPFLGAAPVPAHHVHAAMLMPIGGDAGAAGLLATLIHTGGYLAATGVIAFLVYRYLGVRWLRTLWFNLDLLWALALIATAVIIPWH